MVRLAPGKAGRGRERKAVDVVWDLRRRTTSAWSCVGVARLRLLLGGSGGEASIGGGWLLLRSERS